MKPFYQYYSNQIFLSKKDRWLRRGIYVRGNAQEKFEKILDLKAEAARSPELSARANELMDKQVENCLAFEQVLSVWSELKESNAIALQGEKITNHYYEGQREEHFISYSDISEGVLDSNVKPKYPRAFRDVLPALENIASVRDELYKVSFELDSIYTNLYLTVREWASHIQELEASADTLAVEKANRALSKVMANVTSLDQIEDLSKSTKLEREVVKYVSQMEL